VTPRQVERKHPNIVRSIPCVVERRCVGPFAVLRLHASKIPKPIPSPTFTVKIPAVCRQFGIIVGADLTVRRCRGVSTADPRHPRLVGAGALTRHGAWQRSDRFELLSEPSLDHLSLGGIDNIVVDDNADDRQNDDVTCCASTATQCHLEELQELEHWMPNAPVSAAARSAGGCMRKLGGCLIDSPVCPPALIANSRGRGNLKQSHACSKDVAASQQGIEGGDKREPARGDLCSGRDKERSDTDDKERHEQDGDKTVTGQLAIVVGVKENA